MVKFLKSNYIVVSLLILALGLRLPLLNGSFWLDEAAQVLESARPFSQQLNIDQDFQPPLLHLITHFALRMGDSEWWLRTIGALLPGLGTVLLTYKLGKDKVDQRTGLIAAILLATSSFHIYFSQELRPYSLPAFWAILGWYLIELFQRLRIPKQKSWRIFLDKKLTPYLAFGLVSLLGFYSSYLYPFLFVAQLLYILWQKRQQLPATLITSGIWLILFLPWVPSLLDQLRVGGQVRTGLPGWEEVVSISVYKSLFLTFGKFMFGVVNIDFTLFIGLSLGLLFLAGLKLALDLKIVEVFLKHPHKTIARLKKLPYILQISQFLIWLVIPILLAWLVSFWIPVLRPKRVLYTLPAFYLLIASLPNLFKRKNASLMIIAVFFFTNFWGTFNYFTDPTLQRENWRLLYQKISQGYPAGNATVFHAFPGVFAPWVWYNQDDFPSHSTRVFLVTEDNVRRVVEPVTEYEFVLVFDYLRDLTDPENRITAELEIYGYQEVSVLDQPNIGFVRVFAKPTSILSRVNYQPSVE